MLFQFEELESSDLIRGAIYHAGAGRGLQGEVLSRLLPVGNVGGFRWVGPWAESPLVVLTSSGTGGVWPDYFDEVNGILNYYGDKRAPGEIHQTRGGNRILAKAFSGPSSSSEERLDLPIFLYFASEEHTRNFRFCGQFVPLSSQFPQADGLRIVWRSFNGKGFSNYLATFAQLSNECVSRAWLRNVLRGDKINEAPLAYSNWLLNGLPHSR